MPHLYRRGLTNRQTVWKLDGISRDTVILFPLSIDDYVTEDNPVRFIDAFVRPVLRCECVEEKGLWLL